MRRAYVEKTFRAKTLDTIHEANRIIREYQAQGFTLTLRQLYYQFVARDLLANRQREYKRLGKIVAEARLAGLMDWRAIEDRTRNLEGLAHWTDPADIIAQDARVFRVDRWENQPLRVEVWIEKDALAGVFERVCNRLDVPFFSCRGYTSLSEMWGASERLKFYAADGQRAVLLHFGDHDPSGIDMTRDIIDRLETFGCTLEVRRLALNMAQVEEWDPPPNPAKVTDSRFEGYLHRFGADSWELDALEPSVLAELVETEVQGLRDEDAWRESGEEIEEGRRLLRRVSVRWDDVADFVTHDDDDEQE